MPSGELPSSERVAVRRSASYAFCADKRFTTSLIGFTSGDLSTGGAGDDTLIGDAGNDVLDGGTGNDYLQSDGGPDTYIFNRGYGQDVIYDYEAWTTQVNVIQLGAGIAPSDVTARRGGVNSNDLSDESLFDPLSGNAVLNGIPVEVAPA